MSECDDVRVRRCQTAMMSERVCGVSGGRVGVLGTCGGAVCPPAYEGGSGASLSGTS